MFNFHVQLIIQMMTATPSLEEESNDDTPEEKDKGDEEDLRKKNMNFKISEINLEEELMWISQLRPSPTHKWWDLHFLWRQTSHYHHYQKSNHKSINIIKIVPIAASTIIHARNKKHFQISRFNGNPKFKYHSKGPKSARGFDFLAKTPPNGFLGDPEVFTMYHKHHLFKLRPASPSNKWRIYSCNWPQKLMMIIIIVDDHHHIQMAMMMRIPEVLK